MVKTEIHTSGTFQRRAFAFDIANTDIYYPNRTVCSPWLIAVSLRSGVPYRASFGDLQTELAR